jgi:predicted nucleic acid-binding protein
VTSAGPGAVVDASVALQWLLQDEPLTNEAGRLLEAFLSGRIKIAAPAFMRYEVANTLEQAIRRRRIPEAAAGPAFDFLVGLGISAHADSDFLITEAAGIARKTGATVYDSVYAAYAKSLGFSLVTADESLFRQLASYPVEVHRLGEIDTLL